MKHLPCRFLLMTLSFAVLSLNCAQRDSAEFKKVTTATDKESIDRKAKERRERERRQAIFGHVDLIFQQLLHARHLATILMNRPKPSEIKTGPQCQVRYDYVPNPSPNPHGPFLVADYDACKQPITQKGVRHDVSFSGKELFSAEDGGKVLRAVSSHLTMRIYPQPGSRLPTVTYRITRDFTLHLKQTEGLKEDPSADLLASFSQSNSLEPYFPGDLERLGRWAAKIEGTLILRKAVENFFHLVGISSGAHFHLAYENPRHIHGEVEIAGLTPLEFIEGCDAPKGRFRWEAKEDHHDKTSGEFQIDENSLLESQAHGPAHEKASPIGKCAPK